VETDRDDWVWKSHPHRANNGVFMGRGYHLVNRNQKRSGTVWSLSTIRRSRTGADKCPILHYGAGAWCIQRSCGNEHSPRWDLLRARERRHTGIGYTLLPSPACIVDSSNPWVSPRACMWYKHREMCTRKSRSPSASGEYLLTPIHLPAFAPVLQQPRTRSA